MTRKTSKRLALVAIFLLCTLSACPEDTVPAAVDTFVGSHPTEEFSSPGAVTTWDPMRTDDGLTIVVDTTQDIMFVIDMDGEVIRAFPAWDDGFPDIDYAKPLDGGLLATYPRISPELELENPLNRQRKFFVLDATDGQQLYDWFGAPILQLIHHDFHLLENGNHLILASPYPFSHWSSISIADVRDDVIFELDPSTGEIVWYWSTAAHYDQLPATQDQRDFIVDQTREDIFHTNSIQPLPDAGYDLEMYPEFTPGNILVGQRESNFVFIIDHETGDIVWSLDHDAIGNTGQHMPRMIPTGLPGAGHILLFDNGCCAGLPVATRESSRVLEIEPVSQTVVWSYDIGTSFYSEFRSGAQRLPNGNTLISASQDQRIFEVTTAGEVVWDYQQTAANGHYRAYRVDTGWLSGGDTGPVTPFPW